MPESCRLEFLGKFLANNFALPVAEANICGSLNKESIYNRFAFVENTIGNL